MGRVVPAAVARIMPVVAAAVARIIPAVTAGAVVTPAAMMITAMTME
jgi:hypothetical protein